MAEISAGGQVLGTTGRRQRVLLPDIVRASAPQALQARRFQQEQERLDLLQEQQERRQRGELIATGIAGTGAALSGINVARDLGILGGGETAVTEAVPASVPALTGPGSATLTETQAVPGGTTSVPGGVTQATAPTATTATTTVGGVALAGGAGLLAGGLAGGLTRRFSGLEEGSPESRGAGAATGAATGALAGSVVPGVGTLAGALIGGGAGGLAGSGILEDVALDCIIVTACYGPDSEEVDVARTYRDNKMTKEQLRAYYWLGETLFVPRMKQDEQFREQVRQYLVDPLIRYGRFVVGQPMNAPPPSPEDSRVTQQFLNFLAALGAMMPVFERQNGERW